jgi:hypothetical protein
MKYRLYTLTGRLLLAALVVVPVSAQALTDADCGPNGKVYTDYSVEGGWQVCGPAENRGIADVAKPSPAIQTALETYSRLYSVQEKSTFLTQLEKENPGAAQALVSQISAARAELEAAPNKATYLSALKEKNEALYIALADQTIADNAAFQRLRQSLGQTRLNQLDPGVINTIRNSTTIQNQIGAVPSATPAAPRGPGANIQYTPLEPIPGINTSSTDVPKFLKAMYGILISLGGVVAVGLIVWGGIVYMTSEIADKKTSARKRIQGAFWGLLLLISSYLAINTINPQLLEFRFLNSIGGSGAANATTNPEITNLQKITNADISDCENAGKHLVTQSDGSWICK